MHQKLWLPRRRISRRNMLRGTMVGAAGLAGAMLIGCGDDDEQPASRARRPAEAAHTTGGYRPGTYVVNAGDFAGKSAADWDHAEEIHVRLDEFSFTPNELTFQVGKPYKMVVENAGKVKHEFTAEDFFQSVAWRKAESEETEFKAPFVHEIEVFPGREVELFFVPVVPFDLPAATAGDPSTYSLVCEIPGHFEAGMFGTIRAVGEAVTAPAPVFAPASQGPWVQDARERIDAADWDAAEELEVVLTEFAFEPNELRLHVDQPYKLHLRNAGKVKHEFTAEDFFKTVAFRKAEDASAEFEAPTPLEPEVVAGKEVEVLFITTVKRDPPKPDPAKAETLDLVCEIPGRLKAGMFGRIIVE